MAAIVYQTDKRSGITYAYESVSRWDKEKQQSRSKRTLIGRVDKETGEIVPTRGTNKKNKPTESNKAPVMSARYFYGATYLLDHIGEKTGIAADLQACFPNRYRKILSVAYFMVLEDSSPISRFPKWGKLHKHPFGDAIPSQRISDLFASITEEEKLQFFRLQAKRRIENEYWAYDTTSISSYSNCLKQVKPGNNKEHDQLPQINLALIFGEKSNLPFYYRKLAGNITDVKTVTTLLADIDFLDLKKVNLVMDRGFYSQANINGLYQKHLKFLIGVKRSLSFVKNQIDKVRDTIRDWINYSERHELFMTSVTIDWDYSQKRPYKGDTLRGKRRMYLHIYYNPEQALEDEKKFTKHLLQLQDELESGERNPQHEKQYEKYFSITSTPVRGVKFKVKQQVIDEAKRNYGYFTLASNKIKDAGEALDIYRNKDLAEKAFGNLKDRLSLRRLEVTSELSLDGKLFVEFIALIYLSFIKKTMQGKELFGKYTIQELLDQFDVIECFEHPGHKLHIGEITEKQENLYQEFKIPSPSSL
jgi:hypothetical protein